MMRDKRGSVGILAVIMVLISLDLALAHSGNLSYGIVEISDSDLSRIDLNDGSADDWIEVVGEATLNATDFAASPNFSGYDPSDFDFQMWLGWNDRLNRIYVAMVQVDDVYLNEYRRSESGYNSMSSHDSSVSVSVDGDHSGGEYFYIKSQFSTEEEYLQLQDQQAQLFYILGEVFDGGTHLNLWNNFTNSRYTDWFLYPPYSEGGGRSIGAEPYVTVTEFYLTPFDRLVWNDPEASVVSDLYPGKIVGLLISTSDRDRFVNEIESVFYLPGIQEQRGFGADNFADFTLLKKGEVNLDKSAVEFSSWGGTKHFFQIPRE